MSSSYYHQRHHAKVTAMWPPRAAANEEEALRKIFGTPSLKRSLRLCVRLRRMKGRARAIAPPAGLVRKKVAGRNYHHLTPRARRGAPFYGETSRNLLLIKRWRHVAWHKAFHLLTLEEIINFLTCRLRGTPAQLPVEASYRIPNSLQNARKRRRRQGRRGQQGWRYERHCAARLF